MRTTVTSYLEDFRSRGRATAFAHRRGLRTTRWPYEQTATVAHQIARELEARGIGKGDRVLLCAENSPEWIACFFGCLLRGVIVVPLDIQSDPEFVDRVQGQVSAKLIVTNTSSSNLRSLQILRIEELTSLIAKHPTAPVAVEVASPDSLVEIVFTSGTTAEPKGVCITHRNLLANLVPLEQRIRPYLKWERLVHPIRFLNLVPLSHVFGQFMAIFVPPLLRGEVFFQNELNPTQIMATIKRERISVMVTVPRFLESLREKVERDYEERGQLERFLRDLNSFKDQHFIRRWWRFRRAHQMLGWKFWAFVSGGATLNPETEDFWQRLGFAVIQGYGMTETAALVTVNHPFKAGRGSIGRVMHGQEVKLADDGEILVKGENVSPGYWQEHNRAAANGGWLHTGDIGEKDAEGNLYFKARKRDVIVSAAGVNIYPEDIERVLDREPETRASAVIEIDEGHGPEPLAVLILRDLQTDAKTVIERANQSLAPHQKLRRWFVWTEEDFPRTFTQKVRKQLLAEKVKAELEFSRPPAAVRSTHVAEIISRINNMGPGDIERSARLGIDLKLDSLGRVELLSALEDRYQVEIDEASFGESTTVEDVEKVISEQHHEEAARYPYPRWQQRWPLNWLRRALLHIVAMPITSLMGRPRIEGREHFENLCDPFVLVCNHVTVTDHALALLAMPWRMRARTAIAMDGELLRTWLHPSKSTALFTRAINFLQYCSVVLFFNVFSMPQKTGFRRSFAFAGEAMDRGYNIMIFPEGERTKHGAINHFRPGTGLLIQQLDAFVVPMRIDGLWELKQENRYFARFGEVCVTIGEPIRYANRLPPEEVSADLERRVRALSCQST